MAHRPDHDDWQPVPFGYALFGRLSLGIIKLPFLAGVLWLSGALFFDPFSQLGIAILVLAAVSVVVTEVVSALVERIFVLRHRHNDPGDPVQAVLVALVPLAGGAAGGLFVGAGDGVVVASALAALLVYLPFVLLLDRPWVKGAGREEVKEAWKETKKMTKETFRG